MLLTWWIFCHCVFITYVYNITCYHYYYLFKSRAVFSLYGWRFPLPYCNNSTGESSSNGNGSSYTSDVEKVPLPDMNFVL